MANFKYRHIPLLLIAGVLNLFRIRSVTREEVEARVDNWQADWIGGTSKKQAVDDIMWMING